jgi:hypothetical protein
MSREEKYEIAKQIWAERCGIKIEHVAIKDVNFHLTQLCKKLDMFDSISTIIEFVMRISPFDSLYFTQYGFNENTEVTINGWQWAMKIFGACMQYLNMLQVGDYSKDTGEFYELVHLQDIMEKFRKEKE